MFVNFMFELVFFSLQLFFYVLETQRSRADKLGAVQKFVGIVVVTQDCQSYVERCI